MKIAALLLFALALDAHAIVRRHDREDARYRELARGMDALVDMNLPGGAGTLIAPDWVLTTAHVTSLLKLPHEVAIGGERVAIRRIVAYPGGQVARHDLALVQLAPSRHRDAGRALHRARGRRGCTASKSFTYGCRAIWTGSGRR